MKRTAVILDAPNVKDSSAFWLNLRINKSDGIHFSDLPVSIKILNRFWIMQTINHQWSLFHRIDSL
ncbi:hypothetical protein KSU1_D0162 [Candidatus Jettenia caeni]|uniref:Uncharacterized protein n=1 Tax=Candidatus Jettenia caeni TaxID=247490 RepID=I3IP26_9BACT|nr:hypothetical protein [Candidatus Jettenia sp. AMX1]MCQ3928771.1 hypothetical protein [Candidatus Jettenia sp.]NUN24039.1 hypothetical protein [Candidatus Jettenia caeni]KAA0246744.1 MAG: hypothetical protein EDM77_16425 [Candidatus Jettenia sp. AMX1]MDL1940642.1 hypothetical protein [Candidatus Jettenia sp. AMX1]WKZ15927.1 MAG: hypothetical protein QY317_01215 [Candidatus Jettenia caeni]